MARQNIPRLETRGGEYGFSTLATVVLPPETLEIFKQEEVIPLILEQNGLSGAHSVPRFKTKPKGVSLVTMGVAPEMIPLIRALGGKGSCGAIPIKINVKKEEDTKKADKVDEPVAGTTDEKEEEDETPKATKELPKEKAPEKMDTSDKEDKDSSKNPNEES